MRLHGYCRDPRSDGARRMRHFRFYVVSYGVPCLIIVHPMGQGLPTQPEMSMSEFWNFPGVFS